jgi:hypothetical protein
MAKQFGQEISCGSQFDQAMNDSDNMTKEIWFLKPVGVPHARRRHSLDALSCLLGLLFIAAYIVVLIPYYSNGINEYSNDALIAGAYDYYTPSVAPGPDIEDIYGSQTLGAFAFWYVLCTARCLFLPLALFQLFTLLKYWHSISGIGKTLRLSLLLAVLAVGVLGMLNASKFDSWMEL